MLNVITYILPSKRMAILMQIDLDFILPYLSLHVTTVTHVTHVTTFTHSTTVTNVTTGMYVTIITDAIALTHVTSVHISQLSHML